MRVQTLKPRCGSGGPASLSLCFWTCRPFRPLLQGGRTALHEAVVGGHAPVVRFLLSDPRVDVNSREPEVRRKHAAETITSDDSDTRSHVQFFQTPLWWAIQKKHTAVVRLLVADPRVDTSQLFSVSEGSCESTVLGERR